MSLVVVIVVIKGSIKSLYLAIFVHIVILVLISFAVKTPKPKEQKAKAINSYLYTPKRSTKHINSQTNTAAQTVNNTVQENVNTTKSNNSKPPVTTTSEVKKPLPISEKPNETKHNKTVKKQTSKKFKPLRKANTKTLSPLQQLGKLKTSLNEKFIEQEMLTQFRRRSASVLDGEPIAVPHSTKQITEEEKRKQATINMSSGLTITKGDDGSCTVIRDLSEVGMEGLTSVEGFSCGQSKFDKNFKSHMKNVLKKLGKSK